MNPPTLLFLALLFQMRLLFQNAFAVDVIFGGSFAEHFSKAPLGHTDGLESPCGDRNQRATIDRLAMDFAVREINNSDAILPGVSLGTYVKDSCSNLDYAIQNTLDYQFVRRKFVNNSLECSTNEPRNECCVDTGVATDAPIVAIIAGGYSHLVKAMVNLVGLFKVPVVGYSSTSPSLNKIDYFLRTIPPDTLTTQVIVHLIEKLNWDIVLVVYVNTEFGHYAADSFRAAIRHRKAKICIAFDGRFSKSSDTQEIKKLVDGIKKAKKSRVVAFFGTIEDFVFFEEHSNQHFNFNDYMWITSEVWLRPDLISIPRKIANVLSFIPKQSSALDLFNDYLNGRADVNLTCLPTHEDSNTKLHGSGESSQQIRVSMLANHRNNCSLAYSKYIPLVFDAVYSVALALHNLLECEPGKSCKKPERKKVRSLLKYLRKLNFTNPLTNSKVSFDSNGNPETSHYTAVKLEIGNNWYELIPLGHWTCDQNTSGCSGSLTLNSSVLIKSDSFQSSCGRPCSKGEHKSVKKEFPDCCWECKRCTGNKYSNTSGQMSCWECPKDRWPNSNHTACVEIVPEYLHVNSVSGILIVVWDTLGILLSILVGIVFVKYSSSHIVRASSRQLSLLLLLGISLDFCLLISLLEKPSRTQCALTFVLSHATGCVLSGTLFLKTNRIHRIFRKSAMKAHPRCLGNTCQLFFILVLVAVELVLTILNLVIHPEIGQVKTTYVQLEDSKKAFMLCNFFGRSFRKELLDALLWSYNCGLIFICTYQAYLVRKVPENYNEARYITFTMVTISMNIIVYVITASGMEGYNLVLVYCVFQSVRASVTLGCMFFPRVYVILFQPEKNVPHNPVQSRLGTFVEENIIRIKAQEVKCRKSSEKQDSLSANSGTVSQSGGMSRSRRKVGVQLAAGEYLEDISLPETIQDTAREVHSAGGSTDEPVDSNSTFVVSGVSDSTSRA